MAVVTIEHLPPLRNAEFRPNAEGFVDTGYYADCAALPRDYGTEAWENRPDVSAIRTAVFAALDRLEGETGISAKFSGRSVLVKPNLVTVYHDTGLRRRSYPETTDPRVLDAAVLWLRRHASVVTIVESAGRGFPTRGSFMVSGIDRLARHRGCGLTALDETPVDRYILPKAKYHREILVPEVFSAVVRGEAAYVSVPKLKTNLYTGVTLGFKNAMGVIPYNLRQRSHHYAIDRKLVEMLYLFKPDMVLIDGVVGGEGECPAPVDPVDSRVIIAGDHPVETDRGATRFMGFDPASIKLIRDADELGFGDPEGVRVLESGTASSAAADVSGGGPSDSAPASQKAAANVSGGGGSGSAPSMDSTPGSGVSNPPASNAASGSALSAAGAASGGTSSDSAPAFRTASFKAVPFRTADWMLTSQRVRTRFPEVLVLVGIDRGGLSSADVSAAFGSAADGKKLVREMQESCRGGCVATTRFAFSMFEAEGVRPRKPAALILGAGIERGDERYWFDADGKPYSADDIRHLPMRKAAIGSCARGIAPAADRFLEGCMVLPNGPHMVLHRLTGTGCHVISLRNRNLLPLLGATLGQRSARRRLIRSGEWLDAPLRLEDEPVETRPLAPEEAGLDWVEWPLPPMTTRDKRALLSFEDDAAMATFSGILVFNVVKRILWRVQAIIATAVTLAPSVLSILGAATGGPVLGLRARAWLLVFAGIEALHMAELPTGLKAVKGHAEKKGKPWTAGVKLRAVLGIRFCGYPFWIPKKQGIL